MVWAAPQPAHETIALDHGTYLNVYDVAQDVADLLLGCALADLVATCTLPLIVVLGPVAARSKCSQSRIVVIGFVYDSKPCGWNHTWKL